MMPDKDHASRPRNHRVHARLDSIEERGEKALDRALDRFERRTHLETHVRVAKLLFPLVVLAFGGVLVSLLNLHRLRAVWIFMAAFFAPGGMEIGIPVGIGLGLDPPTIIAIILYADVVGALFLLWNLDLLFKVPKLGAWLGKMEAKAEAKWAKHERLRDMGLLGLCMYCMIPTSLTGIIPSMILGRVAGFPPFLAMLAVLLGAAVRVVVFAYVAAGVKFLYF